MTATDAPAVDLAPMWVPLLRRLTDTIPAWGLWKNADAALAGHGDFDSTAPTSDWGAITAAFQEWATDNGFGPATACHHVPGVLFLVAVDRDGRRLVELDVNARKYFRGWTMFRPEGLAGLMEIDERGFRRVRPGAEAVILLTQNGMRWGGRPDDPGLRRKRVADLLRSDPEGVAAAARLFGPARGALERLAACVAREGWSPRSALAVEAYAVARALASPGILLTRVWAKRVKRRCPVLISIFSNERRVPADVDGWVDDVARAHVVLEAG